MQQELTHCPSLCRFKPSFTLHAISCLKGLKRATELGWLSHTGVVENPIDCFDTVSFLLLDDPSRFNMNLITPKFLAFAGPSKEDDGAESFYQRETSHYFEEFRNIGVRAVEYPQPRVATLARACPTRPPFVILFF